MWLGTRVVVRSGARLNAGAAFGARLVLPPLAAGVGLLTTSTEDGFPTVGGRRAAARVVPYVVPTGDGVYAGLSLTR